MQTFLGFFKLKKKLKNNQTVHAVLGKKKKEKKIRLIQRICYQHDVVDNKCNALILSVFDFSWRGSERLCPDLGVK